MNDATANAEDRGRFIKALSELRLDERPDETKRIEALKATALNRR